MRKVEEMDYEVRTTFGGKAPLTSEDIQAAEEKAAAKTKTIRQTIKTVDSCIEKYLISKIGGGLSDAVYRMQTESSEPFPEGIRLAVRSRGFPPDRKGSLEGGFDLEVRCGDEIEFDFDEEKQGEGIRRATLYRDGAAYAETTVYYAKCEKARISESEVRRMEEWARQRAYRPGDGPS